MKLKNLFLQSSRHSDVIFVCSGSQGFSSHRCVLAAASPLLKTLFKLNLASEDEDGAERFYVKNGSTTVSSFSSNFRFIQLFEKFVFMALHFSLQSFMMRDTDLEDDLKLLQRQSTSGDDQSGAVSGVCEARLGPGVFRQLSHPVFTSISLQQCLLQGEDRCCSSLQTVLSCSYEVTAATLKIVLDYLTTGTVDLEFDQLQRVITLARMMELEDLYKYLTETPLLGHIHTQIQDDDHRSKMMEESLEEMLFPDVWFQLEDGVMGVNRAVLCARSDVMAAMFSENFIEGCSMSVTLPGVQK